jgi:uncharacterized protein (TIGR02246 family)
MSAPATVSPEETVTALFQAFDTLDPDAIEPLFAADPQGVDEMSRGWLRGRDKLHGYLQQIKEAGLSDVQSDVSDVHATEWGDASVVTCMLDQSYVVGGERQSIHAPTTIVLRREDGAWRVAVVHSVPLPEAETT